jgi:phosphoribosylformylglycinamidine cyclo-ligase
LGLPIQLAKLLMLDIVRTIIVDSTVTARMKRSKVIDNANIKAGMIVGLASFGQATYEKKL